MPDPIGDIAVLGAPDGQHFKECEAYEALMETSRPLPIVDAPKTDRAWLLSLDGHWFRCVVTHNGGPLWIRDAAEGIVGGMSGSPIVADDGTAIGVICTGAGTVGGPNPRLVYHLPTRFLPRR